MTAPDAVQTPTRLVDVAVGDEAPVLEFGPLTRTHIVRYAGAGGDFNPAHHDEVFATRAGMPSVFAHGLLTAGLLSRVVSGWLGLANVRSFGVRFTGQVWPGDILTCSGRVASIDEDAGTRVAVLALSVARQDGEQVVRGHATAEVV